MKYQEKLEYYGKKLSEVGSGINFDYGIFISKLEKQRNTSLIGVRDRRLIAWRTKCLKGYNSGWINPMLMSQYNLFGNDLYQFESSIGKILSLKQMPIGVYILYVKKRPPDIVEGSVALRFTLNRIGRHRRIRARLLFALPKKTGMRIKNPYNKKIHDVRKKTKYDYSTHNYYNYPLCALLYDKEYCKVVLSRRTQRGNIYAIWGLIDMNITDYLTYPIHVKLSSIRL